MKTKHKGVKSIAQIDAKGMKIAKSKKRMELLTANIFQAINKTAEEIEGNFSIFEIQDSLLRISHSYNKRFLDQENEIKPVANEIKVVDEEVLKKE